MERVTIYAHKSNYETGRNQAIKYIVLHYTANNGDTGAGNGNYFSQPNRYASAHYFVDENSVTLSVREEDTAWHCGANAYRHKQCRNANSIGIEMCSEKDKNGIYYINDATKCTAQVLVKELMQKYKICTDNVLLHYDVTGKQCPEPFVRQPEQWVAFKQALEEKELTAEQAKGIIKEKLHFDDNTMCFLSCYRFADALLTRIAQNLK